MVRKSPKNSKNIVELIHSATLPALLLLAQEDKFAFFAMLDPAQPEDEARAGLLEHIAQIKPEDISLADQEAVRLLQLMSFRTEAMLERACQQLEQEQHPEIDTFDRWADPMTRLIWLRVNAPPVFDQIETIYLTHHFHGHKKFLGFTVRDGEGRPFEWTPEVAERLLEGVIRILKLDEEAKQNCEILHFEMEEEGRSLHYLVVYHPGKMKLLRQMKDRRRSLFLFTPALEATLVYDPAENRVYVLSDKQSTARRLADQFALTGFDRPLSKQPVDAISYELSMFKQAVPLKGAQVRGAILLDAWVSSLSVSLGHTRHTVMLGLSHTDDLWEVSDLHFGERNPISRCRSILEVKLSFVIRFDGETEPRSLDITVGKRGSNLLTQPNPRLRRCGEDILTSLGIMKRVKPAQVGEDRRLFDAEIKLLDLALDKVDGYLLSELDLPAEDLVSKGLLRKKAPGEFITVPIEDEEGQPGYRRLPVNFSSTRTWAEDEVSGECYELSEGELSSYGVNKSYLRERFRHLLKTQLIHIPLIADDQEPYFLGNYRMGDQYLPVVLVSRLWDAVHAGRMDTELRQSNLGLTLVLSTTSDSPWRFLGPGIVVPVHTLLEEHEGKVQLDLSRVEGEVRRRQGVVTSTEVPRLIREDGRNAMLVGPWSDPWVLTKKEWVDVVDVLVTAWTSHRKKCTKPQLEAAAGVSIRSLKELFRGAPEWKHYIRGADGNYKPREWELNIGTPDYGVAERYGGRSLFDVLELEEIA